MNKKIFFLLTLCIAAVSCGNDKKTEDVLNIDMLDYMQDQIPANIEDLFSVVSFVKLESSDSSYLSRDAYVKYVDSGNIYIESELRLLRFNASGKFLNRIGSRGGGPGEYPYVGRVFGFETGKLFLSNAGKLMEYNRARELLSTTLMNSGSISISMSTDSTIREIFRIYGKDGQLEERLILKNKSGTIINENKLYKDSLDVNIVWTGVPERYIINDIEYYRDEWSNEVFEIDNHNSIKKSLHFNFSDKEANRTDYQDGKKRSKLGKNVVMVSEWITNGAMSFMKLFYDEAMYLTVIDHQKGRCIFSERYDRNSDPTIPPGIDLKGMPSVKVWPEYVDKEGKMYAFIDPAAISDEDMTKLHLYKNIETDIEDNSILIILN